MSRGCVFSLLYSGFTRIPHYVTSSDIYIGDGYPEMSDGQLLSLIYAIAQRTNRLCAAGSALRKRRDADGYFLTRSKRDVSGNN